MDAREAATLEHERRRWLRPDWERYLRPDWENYVHPAHRDAMRQEFAERKAALGTWRCSRERVRDEQVAREELREEKAALERENAWEAECAARKLRSDLAWERFKRSVHEMFSRKAGFNPDQPRDEFGRWADGGQGLSPAGGINDPRVVSDAQPVQEWKPGARYAANDDRRSPTLGHNNPPKDIPPTRPEDSRARTGAIRAAGAFLAKISPPIARAAALLAIFEGAHWLREHRAEIETQLDPRKTLKELQDAVDTPRPGTEVHHIVERSAEGDGIPRSKINAPDNLVRIGRQQHQKISEWYSTGSPQYGNQAPRDWLRGKSWEERRAIGIQKLIDVGVLKR